MKARPGNPTPFLIGALAWSLLLVMLIGCRRSAEADGAVTQASPGAEAAPAIAPADTPPAKPATPPAGDTSTAGGAPDTGATDAVSGTPNGPAETPAAPGAAAAAQATGDVVNGWKQYEANCSRCHGQDALGSAIAPDPRKSVSTLGQAGFVQTVKEGRVATGMPGFSAQLDDRQINDIHAYVVARSSGKLPPGRPKT